MACPAETLADAAASLIGTPFRLHGRDPQTGLDCLGLVGAALGMAGRPISLPYHYTLRMRGIDPLLPLAEKAGLQPAKSAPTAGDILLLHVGPCQFHLGITAQDLGLIHAHAGLRRVVHSPAPQGIIKRWRLPETA
ncbi:NlpC/P60 family protein [Novosphingobium terrae]|uniref:NlpC/P60 family protein n=1 Tax=Novosphingobium terrae TaxID=2726189 RepID=UPI00197FEEDA|nr:NlpC/P60 family protein [Novosphingobium terrae]